MQLSSLYFIGFKFGLNWSYLREKIRVELRQLSTAKHGSRPQKSIRHKKSEIEYTKTFDAKQLNNVLTLLS